MFKYSLKGVRHMSRWLAFGLMLACSVFTAFGQFFFKRGAMLLPELLTNWYILAGFVSAGVGMLFFVLALRLGELNVLYPVLATSYIWINILALFFLGERVGVLKWVGVFSIVIGISYIGWGSNHD